MRSVIVTFSEARLSVKEHYNYRSFAQYAAYFTLMNIANPNASSEIEYHAPVKFIGVVNY